jgi:hypothetical protein
VMPHNAAPRTPMLRSLMLQTNRYAWELLLPRLRFHRPPVLSTCWLITRSALEAAGGFKAVRRSVVPERYLARTIGVHDGDYRFLRATTELGLVSEKQVENQYNTALRTRYPQLHRRPELTLLVSVAEGAVFVGPVLMFALGLLLGQPLLSLISFCSYAVGASVYGHVMSQAYSTYGVTGKLVMPFAAVYDIAILNYSMWCYEFREVLWKGRNVCLPAMQVIPHLPKIQ